MQTSWEEIVFPLSGDVQLLSELYLPLESVYTVLLACALPG
ncbi:MAG: hypothetical protein WAN59_10225 [Candidatus Baltobacteraceae bacterium]